MPSKDPINPKANDWMQRDDSVARSVPARQPATAEPRPTRQMSGTILRLAAALGKKPDEVAAKLTPDTIRRTQYPVIEIQNPDGTKSFKHDPLIVEGRRAEVRP